MSSSTPVQGSRRLGETVEIARLPQAAYVWRERDGVLVLVDCNSAARALEPNTERLLGMTIDELAQTNPELAAHILRSFRDEAAITVEGPYQRILDGKERVLRSTFVFAPPATVIAHAEDVTDQRRNEQDLREAGELLRAAFHSSPLGKALISIDPDDAGRIIEVNPSYCAIFGYSRDEVIGEVAPASLSHPDDREIGVEDLRRLVAGEISSCQFEKRFIRADGTTVVVALWVSLIEGTEGERRCALVHYEDVTERRRDELELHEARMRFEGAFEHAPIGMAVVDLDEQSFGRLRRVNAALCLLLGRGREELVGLRLRDLTHPDDVEANLAAATRLLDGETDSYHTEKRFLTPAGDVLVTSFSASVVRDAAGNPLYGVAQVDDVTGRRRAEAEVLERERRFRSAFSLALDAMWICDDNRLLTQVNRATSELLGLPIEDITGRQFGEFTPMDRGELDKVWARFLENGGLTEQFEVLTADGEVRQVEVSARANFTPGRHLSILRDVTERHRAEEARERARAETDRLEAALHQAQKMETVGQLAGGVAHDFNNILAVILNASEFALKDLDDHPAARDVEAIRDAAKRAAALTRQLLVFSRREISQPEILDLRKLVCSVEDLLRRTIGEHIELTVDITDDIPAIEADPSHVEQVLLNLAVNARDAMPEGGRLCLGLSAIDLDEEQARLQPGLAPGRYARLTVTDTRTGMSEEVLERAFEPFFTTKAKGMGTGLGLATTYGIVRENKGHVELRSVTGSGTTATVLLPAAVGDRPVATNEKVPDRHGAGQRILLVEDDEAVRTITERMLTSNGYDVICAADPVVAREIAADEGVDGVVTDVVMPGMSGPALVKKLREVIPNLPALFVSGYTDRPGALPRGARFLSKPFSRETLLTAIADMLEDDA